MLNHIINIAWTIFGFFPVCYFWFLQHIDWPFYLLLCFSLATCFLPERIYRNLDISKDSRVYKRMGIKFVRRFAQDGNFQPGHGAGIKAYLKSITVFERYHFCCLVFFQASSVLACYHEQYILSFFIFISNIIYNVYPILLQQYNRMRITKLVKQHQL